jgi:hypothetical protein
MHGIEVHMAFWLGNTNRRDHLQDLGFDRIILKWILKKQDEGMWTGFIWLRIGTSGRLLCRQ